MSPEVTPSLAAKRDQLLTDLSVIEDPYERLSYVIDLGKQLPPLAEEFRIEPFRIEGCTSNLWVYPSFEDGQCLYAADSDSAVTKGVAAVLTGLYSGHAPGEILAVPPDFLADAGIPQLLSSNRRNGLANLTKKIMDYAALCAKEYGN